jgi:hypothetical protein
MDFSNRFSLEDFLAYFFPGVIASCGIFVLLLLTPLKANLLEQTANITTGVIFVVVSYILGVILSGFSEIPFSWIKGYKAAIPAKMLRPSFVEAFQKTFAISGKSPFTWSRDYFYLCRSLVISHIPNAASLIQRQSSLRQLRINLLPSYVIWLAAGLLWGGWWIGNGDPTLGWGLVIGSFVLVGLIGWITAERAISNEYREVREVLTAFEAGYRTGLFKK